MNLSHWVNQYKQNSPDPEIQYWDGSKLKTERSHDLGNISITLQRRSSAPLRLTELRDVAAWQSVDWDTARRLKKNDPPEIAAACNDGFDGSKSVADRVSFLCELQGVTVPLASALLTVYNPDEFGVLGYHQIRALAAVRPGLADPRSYRKFAEFADWVNYHRRRPSIYEEYVNEIRNVASANGLTPHEVEMALTSFDQSNA